MKSIVLFVAVAFLFLGTGAAYGMGGGGSGGDGRWNFQQNHGTTGGSATNSPAQVTGTGQGTGSAQVTGSGQTALVTNATPLGVVSIPEPVTLLLLGSGFIGLVGLRRKFRK